MNKHKHKTTIILIKPILVFYPIKMNKHKHKQQLLSIKPILNFYQIRMNMNKHKNKHKHKTTIIFNQTNSNFLYNKNE